MIASHLIFSAYGHWLPNDPRGSWSDYVRNRKLLAFGNATTVQTRKSLAHVPHNATSRLQAKESLQYSPVQFSGLQARTIGRGFTQAVAESGYRVYACAIMPTHVHVVMANHIHSPKRIVGHLKGRATHHLNTEELHPLANQASPWSVGSWVVFLDDDESVIHAIDYVCANPAKEGLPLQKWPFVVPYP